MIEWIANNWLYITFGILLLDKLVTITPPTFKVGNWEVGKYDDMIWSAIKGAFLQVFKPKQ